MAPQASPSTEGFTRGYTLEKGQSWWDLDTEEAIREAAPADIQEDRAWGEMGTEASAQVAVWEPVAISQQQGMQAMASTEVRNMPQVMYLEVADHDPPCLGQFRILQAFMDSLQIHSMALMMWLPTPA